MKRFTFILFAFLSLFVSAQALGPDIKKIVDRGVLQVAMVATDEPPFFMVDEKGVLIGSDVELAQNLAKALGVRVEFNRNFPTYDAVAAAIGNHEADLAVSNLSRTEPRAKSFYFSNSYNEFHLGLAINRTELAKKPEEESLHLYIMKHNFKIGALAGAYYQRLGQSIFAKDSIIGYPTNDDGFEAVRKGEIFAYFTHELDLVQFMLNRPEAGLKVKTVLFDDIVDHIAIAVPTGMEHFLFWVNTYLETSPPGFTVQKLFEKYKQFLVHPEKEAP